MGGLALPEGGAPSAPDSAAARLGSCHFGAAIPRRGALWHEREVPLSDMQLELGRIGEGVELAIGALELGGHDGADSSAQYPRRNARQR
eukprot:1411509-Pyramimonas_sp.AAC.1